MDVSVDVGPGRVHNAHASASYGFEVLHDLERAIDATIQKYEKGRLKAESRMPKGNKGQGL